MSDQLQAVRDDIAEMCGWSITDTPTQDGDPPRKIWRRGRLLRWEHPIPTSLDFVSRVWPDGYGDGPWRFPDLWDAKTHSQRVLTALMHLRERLNWMQEDDRRAFDAACAKIRKEIGK